MEADTCPWTKSRQKDAPPRKTNLEAAVEAVRMCSDKMQTVHWALSLNEVKAILAVFKINPDAPVKEEA
jgi:hypothetical protein